MTKINRALISVSDKTGIVDFAKELSLLGIEIISTGGTATVLRKAQIQVTDISEYTGFPEILDGRLKTLHPKIHGGILSVRENKEHDNQIKENDISPIDLVVVNLYPFESTISKLDCKFEHAIENIDIGGPTMLRAGAKNHNHVAVVCDPKDYNYIIEELKETGGGITTKTRFHLAKKVFVHTAGYDAAIASYINKYDDYKSDQGVSDVITYTFEKQQSLRYGENPHQKAGFYKAENSDEISIVNSIQLHGKELSYNNIMDSDATITMVSEFIDSSYVSTIVKHGNPCGIAVSEKDLADSFSNAVECDPISAFGGIVGFNALVDKEVASLIVKSFFEVIIAPEFSEEALSILMKKKNIRLLKISDLGKKSITSKYSFREVVGGILVQERDLIREKIKEAKIVTKRSPTDEEWKALDFAWKVCKHVKSNAIVYADNNKTLGIGAGQMSRIDSSKIAVQKAKKSLKGSVIASDAFFPFRDGIDEAVKAGVTAVIQPGGSLRDKEVIEAANEHNLAMVFTGIRHFRH